MAKRKYTELITNCKYHGIGVEAAKRSGNNGLRCKQCTREAVSERRRKIKKMAIEYKGEKCEICGYDRCSGALDFHHLDESKKEFGIASKGHCRSWKKVKIELDKCILICCRCHREIHEGLIVVPG